MRAFFIVSQICADSPCHDHHERAVSHVHPISLTNKPIRVEQMGYWAQRLDQVHKSESFRHTERSLHRILRCFAIYLAKDLCLFVKRIHLRLHKLSLNFDHFLEILG